MASSIESTPPRHTAYPTDIRTEVNKALATAYGGKICAITKRTSPIEWCRVVYAAGVPTSQCIEESKKLGLVSEDVDISSKVNLFPLAIDLHAHFENRQLILYPDQQHLIDRIAMEEAHLAKREQAIATGQSDPGRLNYEQSYGMFNTRSTFMAFSGIGTNEAYLLVYASGIPQVYSLPPKGTLHAPVPPFELEISIELFLLQRAGDISSCLPSTPEIRLLEYLGNYLRQLWYATPADFRQLRHEPAQTLTQLLQPLPPLPSNFSPSAHSCNPSGGPASEQDIPTGFTHGLDAFKASAEEPAEDQIRYDRALAWVSTFPGERVKEDAKADKHLPDDTKLDADMNHWDSLESVIENNTAEPTESGVYQTLTSNEHALVIYGVRLGGPVWNHRYPPLENEAC